MEQIISQAWLNYLNFLQFILLLLFITDIELQASLNLFDFIPPSQILVWKHLGDLEGNSCLKQWTNRKQKQNHRVTQQYKKEKQMNLASDDK